MTDQPTPTPRTDAAEIDFSCETLTIHTRYVRADFARELERELQFNEKVSKQIFGANERLERELAACVPGMELIARMLSDERSLADRLADAVADLRQLLKAFGLGDQTGREALAAWKEARREP